SSSGRADPHSLPTRRSSDLGASGVDMDQVIKVGKALLFSPLIGFAFAAILFILVKKVFKKQVELFQPPEGNKPPPPLIRAILIRSEEHTSELQSRENLVCRL